MKKGEDDGTMETGDKARDSKNLGAGHRNWRHVGSVLFNSRGWIVLKELPGRVHIFEKKE